MYIYNVRLFELTLSLSIHLFLSLQPSSLSLSLPSFIQIQADLIKEAVDGMYEPTPPLFDPLGEGVDVSDIETSVSSGTTGASSTLKGGHKAKVSTGSVNKVHRTKGEGGGLSLAWVEVHACTCMWVVCLFPICVQYWDGLNYNNVNNPHMKFTHKFLKRFFK